MLPKTEAKKSSASVDSNKTPDKTPLPLFWRLLPDFITGESDLIREVRNTRGNFIDLSGTRLGIKTSAELVQILTAIPASVVMLYFPYNDLGSKTDAELQQIFAAIPSSVKSLNLPYNGLGSKTGAGLGKALAAITAPIKNLGLVLNSLGSKTGLELVQVLSVIPCSVTDLSLSRNDLGNIKGTELAQALSAIPASVTTLHLSGNDLGSKTVEELVEILASVTESVSELTLSYNDLGGKTVEELVEILAAIPVSVTRLDLSYNNLGIKTQSELVQILEAIPGSVVNLSLSGNVKEGGGAIDSLTSCITLDRSMSPLEYLIEIGDLDRAKKILERKDLDVNCKDFLFKAVSQGKLDVVMLLLEHPDIKINNTQYFKNKQVTLRDMAILYGHHEIANAIDEHERKALDSSKNTAEVVNSLYFQYIATDNQEDDYTVDFETTIQEQSQANANKNGSSSLNRRG